MHSAIQTLWSRPPQNRWREGKKTVYELPAKTREKKKETPMLSSLSVIIH
jgi:hypothetical protein